MVDYTTMVANIDFTYLDPINMFHKLNKLRIHEWRISSFEGAASSTQGESLQPVLVSGSTQVYKSHLLAPMKGDPSSIGLARFFSEVRIKKQFPT